MKFISTDNSDIVQQDLIKLLQQGDNEGYGKLYDNYAPMLFGIICRIVGEKEDAENLLALLLSRQLKTTCQELRASRLMATGK